MEKVMAYRHSQDVDGKRVRKDEVKILSSSVENDVRTYIVLTQDGLKCTAIYNIFTGSFYVDDVYGIIKDTAKKKSDVQM